MRNLKNSHYIEIDNTKKTYRIKETKEDISNSAMFFSIPEKRSKNYKIDLKRSLLNSIMSWYKNNEYKENIEGNSYMSIIRLKHKLYNEYLSDIQLSKMDEDVVNYYLSYIVENELF